MAVEEEEINNKKQKRNPCSTTMAKSEEPPEHSPPATTAWGTWEELLLAYAVNRYGTKSWDSISSELRKRSSAPIHLTPHHCQQKYGELKRRFNQSDNVDVDNMDDDGSDDTTTATAIPWLEELRKLRVLELQRELENYDLYISSLQLKVKKLTEESEIEIEGGEKVDLGQRNEEIELEKPEVEEEAKKKKNETAEAVVSGEEEEEEEDSDRDNQSVNGSNGNLNLETGVEKSENENEASPVGTGDEKPESAAALLSPVREEDSCNGRPDGGKAVEPVKSEPEAASESIAESKSEGTMKENYSDVQSSASKSRIRKERVDRVRRGSTKGPGDERENEDQSTDSIPVRSLPLLDFLHRLHKLGSPIFDRRLDRQEKLRYKNLIRQHIDYEILQTRLKEGWYSDGNDKFFRDLLLLVNNTRVFYPKESPESASAIELRQLILKEMMSKKKQKSDAKVTEKQTSSKSTNLPPKRAAEPPDSLLLKPKLSGPIIVCRKRSSITAKAAGSSSGAERRKEQQTEVKNSEKVVEETPKRSRDGFPLISKKKGKNVRGNASENSSQDQAKTPANDACDSKNDKKKKLTEAEEKKQSAAKFLNRMKRTSPASNNEPLLNTLKGTAVGGSGGGGGGGSENDGKGVGEPKRGGGVKGGGGGVGDGKKDQVAKKGSGGRQVKEQGSPAKRSVGRPPKRAAAPPPMAALGKRNRDSGESETLGSKQTKKRSKR